MSAKLNGQVEPAADPNAPLERALMDEYLHTKGYSLEDLKKLPKDLVEELMKEASQYASLKMEEVAARSHLINELHEDSLKNK